MVEDRNKALAGVFNSPLSNGDRCHSIEHLMRLPGTVNLPDKRKRDLGWVMVRVELIAFTDRLYGSTTLN